MTDFRVQTHERTEMVDITASVVEAIREAGLQDGLCVVYCPHTTAAITINENADPDVPRDIRFELDKVIPFDDGYHHGEGNSAAHIKSSLVGCSETLIVENGSPVLGTWQGIYFCEFDGPRNRRVIVKTLAR